MKHGFPDESLGLAFNEWEKGGKVPEGLALPSASPSGTFSCH